MIKNFHILFLVPFWYWLHILLMPNFINNFPYENKDDEGKWTCEIILENYFGDSRIISTINYDGKLYSAYIKTRLMALKYSMKYSSPCFGIVYKIKKEN